LVEGNAAESTASLQFQSLVIQAGTKGPQIASIEMLVNGEKKYAMSEGNGPVDAIFKSIRMIVPHDAAKLLLYQVHAVTGGTDAQATVTVKIEEDGKTVVGQGSDKRNRALPPEAMG